MHKKRLSIYSKAVPMDRDRHKKKQKTKKKAEDFIYYYNTFDRKINMIHFVPST